MAPRFDRPKSILTSVNAQQPQVAQPQSQNVGGSSRPAGGPTSAVFKKPLVESNHPFGAGSGGASGPMPVNVAAVNAKNPAQGSRPASIPRQHVNLNEEGNAFGGELNNIDILEHMKSLRDQIKRIIESNPKRTEDDGKSSRIRASCASAI